MRPLNVLDEYVWHYTDGHLFTLNPEICYLLEAITIDGADVKLDPGYESQLKEADVLEYYRKINFILQKLYSSQVIYFSALRDLESEKKKNKGAIGFSYRHIMHLTPENSVTLRIKLPINEQCDCLACTYQSLDFGRFIQKVEQLDESEEPDTLELAYAHYLLCTDNFKRAYQIHKNIERKDKGDDKRVLEYFCVKYNIRHLHNLFFDDDKYSAKCVKMPDP